MFKTLGELSRELKFHDSKSMLFSTKGKRLLKGIQFYHNSKPLTVYVKKTTIRYYVLNDHFEWVLRNATNEFLDTLCILESEYALITNKPYIPPKIDLEINESESKESSNVTGTVIVVGFSLALAALIGKHAYSSFK